MDTSQEALEPIGRILDLEAFPRFGKPELPSSSRENNCAGQIMWAEVEVEARVPGCNSLPFLCTGNSHRPVWMPQTSTTHQPATLLGRPSTHKWQWLLPWFYHSGTMSKAFPFSGPRFPHLYNGYQCQLSHRLVLRCHEITGPSQVALVVKNLPANAGDIGDMGLIPGSGRSPEGGRGNPFQYSCLENPMDRGAW